MIITVSGGLNSGKDVVAKMVQNYFLEKDEVFYIISWADKIKEIASIILSEDKGIFYTQEGKRKTLPPHWWYYEREGKRYSYAQGLPSGVEGDYVLVKPTIRQFLQEIGTELFRDRLHPDTWINALIYDTDTYFLHKIIPDTRFANELRYSDFSIYVHRPMELRFPNQFQKVTDIIGRKPANNIEFMLYLKEVDLDLYNSLNHSSETDLDSVFDFYLGNDSDLYTLKCKVESKLDSLLDKEPFISKLKNLK